jgi:NACalpha-BTF3-like transcription factor
MVGDIHIISPRLPSACPISYLMDGPGLLAGGSRPEPHDTPAEAHATGTSPDSERVSRPSEEVLLPTWSLPGQEREVRVHTQEVHAQAQETTVEDEVDHYQMTFPWLPSVQDVTILSDVSIIATQCDCSRETAYRALINANYNIVDAMMYLLDLNPAMLAAHDAFWSRHQHPPPYSRCDEPPSYSESQRLACLHDQRCTCETCVRRNIHDSTLPHNRGTQDTISYLILPRIDFDLPHIEFNWDYASTFLSHPPANHD